MDSALKSAVTSFIDKEKLPEGYLDEVEQWILPLAEELLRKVSVHQGSFVLGISGSQGSGKSSLAELLVILFRTLAGLHAINLSLDDFYLTLAERRELAAAVHPLFLTRGVPGTHDVSLAVNTLERLKGPGPVAIPRFDKARDDRMPQSQWPRVQGPVDVILLEGWCLGVEPQAEAELQAPANTLEREDPEGRWRRHVNEQLEQCYPALFDLMDLIIMLRAPAFEQVLGWRQKQEEKLAQRTQGLQNSRVMSQAELTRFIQHYERLTRHALETLPGKADIVFQLGNEQNILSRIKG